MPATRATEDGRSGTWAVCAQQAGLYETALRAVSASLTDVLATAPAGQSREIARIRDYVADVLARGAQISDAARTGEESA